MGTWKELSPRKSGNILRHTEKLFSYVTRHSIKRQIVTESLTEIYSKMRLQRFTTTGSESSSVAVTKYYNKANITKRLALAFDTSGDDTSGKHITVKTWLSPRGLIWVGVYSKGGLVKRRAYWDPVYTIPFSNGDGTEMFCFGLPSTLYRFPIQHQMKTVA